MSKRLRPFAVPFLTFAGCWFVSLIIHNPVPRIHDEFSYFLMGETFARGHVANASPPLPEFFDTFHVLVRPAYASKYFPVQGIFLALGEKLAGHPAIGVWLSSALACAALVWMLQAWISPGWALLGGFIVVVQYGMYSYWSQTYWGGMATALGGALFFGALRRLWDRLSWQHSIWLALGLVILANSRPLEGALAALPGTVLFSYHIAKNRRWHEHGFWPKVVLPCFSVLALGALATGSYNRAITGSALKPPYVLHEQQYQETPPFIFLPKRSELTYSSVWLRYYYEFQELHLYDSQRIPKLWVLAVARKIATWWDFYCGILLSVPLFLPGLLKKGRTRIFQGIFLAGFLILPMISDYKVAWRILIDLLAPLEIGVLWYVFDDLWPRLAIGTSSLLIFEFFFVKWSFPHYFAPAACLVWYLQTEGLRRIWVWAPHAEPDRPLTRTERRGMARDKRPKPKRVLNLRGIVYAMPVLCVISLVWRVEGRLNGWKDDPHGPDRGTLLLNNWSVRRAELDHWLEQETKPQLVFVRYSRRHNVNNEWVYNHADIMQSHVIWARDLGADHNKLLLSLLSDRSAWLLEADAREPELVPYAEAERMAEPTSQELPGKSGTSTEQDEQTNW
ncbi:MAG: hypothetical protein ACLQBK_24010 [Candidatus Sulfotelmatobacter sp.]